MRILALETSCDETAAAVVEDGRRVLSHVVASQVELHSRYGGVVPELAARAHITNLIPVLEKALEPVGREGFDAVAVTQGPGLPGALMTGISFAKGIAYAAGKPLVAVHHLEAHIYASWLIPPGREADPPDPPPFPALALVVSGGHTFLAAVRDHGQVKVLGQTLDDAAGEAFDKVARLLGLGYPGGPAIERAAKKGHPDRIPLPRAWLSGTYNFSFSGLKTAVLREVQKAYPSARMTFAGERPARESSVRLDPQFVADLAAAFQQSVVDVLVEKTVRAARALGARSVILAGGVAANQLLRSALEEEVRRLGLPFYVPPLTFCTDNAAMVGAAAFYRYEDGLQRGWDLAAAPALRLGQPSSGEAPE